jgi:ATP synthase protein I
MSDDPDDFARQVAVKAERKSKAQCQGRKTIWFGLGMSGLIGWAVAIPTLAGALLGVWWDRHHPGPHSLTLALLVAGLSLGCANAWYWVSRQDQAINDGEDNGNE